MYVDAISNFLSLVILVLILCSFPLPENIYSVSDAVLLETDEFLP